MAELKFSCPNCNQHIACDTGYVGAQITCPTCKQAIIVPQAPRSAAAPPVAPIPPQAPPPLSTRQSTAAPAAGQRFAGAGAPLPPKKSGALKTVVAVTAALVVAAIGIFGVTFVLHHKSKGNPAAQVAVPSANSTMQALSILSKARAAYTNVTSVKADGTFTAFLNISNITMGDINPNAPANMRDRRPPGMPRIVTTTTTLTIKSERTNFFYIAGESVSKVDHQTSSNTFALWKSDKGQFSFTDMHRPGIEPMYRQLPETDATKMPTEQIKKIQEMFQDPANLTKLVKDLGQTADESVNGQSCYTLTAKVLGQKMKVWVDKSTCLIPQWQITLGGEISDADIDDVFSLASSAFTNIPPMTLEMIKPQVKKFAPVMMKIRGTLAFTTENIEANPTLTADDFNYPVPPGVRLIPMSTPQRSRTMASAPDLTEVNQRNACINNLRMVDAAKNQWALENGKKDGTPVTEDDLKPYIGPAGRSFPKCPSGGTYTIGKIGEKPTCSIPDHTLN